MKEGRRREGGITIRLLPGPTGQKRRRRRSRSFFRSMKTWASDRVRPRAACVMAQKWETLLSRPPTTGRNATSPSLPPSRAFAFSPTPFLPRLYSAASRESRDLTRKENRTDRLRRASRMTGTETAHIRLRHSSVLKRRWNFDLRPSRTSGRRKIPYLWPAKPLVSSYRRTKPPVQAGGLA